MKEKTTKPGYGKLLDAWVPPEGAGDPVGCVATSFTFTPAFFEEECLGRFLQLESNAEDDGPAYLVEREEKLRQLDCAAALVDQHHAHGMRSLRWDLLAARPRSGILHAKVSLLLWSTHARLVIASANLTEPGYRLNHEVFAVLDFFTGSEAPLLVLDDTTTFLQETVRFAQPAEGSPGSVVERWLRFLKRVKKETRTWGSTEAPRGWSRPRVAAVFTGPDRPDALAILRGLWPEQRLPERAFIISPFFDPPDAPNEPARQLWGILKRGRANVEYHVTAEDVPGERAVLVHAPESLLEATPPALPAGVGTSFRQLRLEDARPLHAKCLWLENDRFVLHLVGSSNFTSPGLGLSRTNLEANLAFVVGQQSGGPAAALRNSWLPEEGFPDDVELRWKPRRDEDEAAAGNPLLPVEFAEATFGNNPSVGSYLRFTFAGLPPAGWAVFPEEAEAGAFVTEAKWDAEGRPRPWLVAWSQARPPSVLRVSWRESGGFAWWPVNVDDGDALPPPEALRELPLEVLIEILTSAKPLHRALAPWLKRKPTGGQSTETVALDPHKRVNTSAFLLQRTRRLSWALSALRERLERPVVSDQALGWRLRGPVGVLALAQAISRETEGRSGLERAFLLTELCLELKRVRLQEAPGCLSRAAVRRALGELIAELRGWIAKESVAGEPSLAAYMQSVFEKEAGA